MAENIFLDLEKQIKSVKIEGFIIQQGTERLYEFFKNKKVQEKPSKVYSVTKSIVSLLIGILVDKGILSSIHIPLYNYFPELQNTNEPWKKEITIYHLLTMTSGFKPGNMQGSKNWVQYILEQPVQNEPGSSFQYNSGESHLLSAIIQKVTGITTAEFAEQNLFGPLGIKKYIWIRDPQGIYGGGFSLSLSTEDMMKIGLLLLNGGRMGSKQLVSAVWVTEAQKPYQTTETTEEGRYGYGYQFWTYNSSSINYYYANGIFGQYIFVVPELNIVAVVKSQLQDQQQTLPQLYFEEFLKSYQHCKIGW